MDLERGMWRARVGCPGVPPVPGGGYLLGPDRTSSMEQICLVWVKRSFFQGCRCASTAASHVSICSCSGVCGVCGVTCVPWWQLTMTFKMRARKCRSHGCWLLPGGWEAAVLGPCRVSPCFLQVGSGSDSLADPRACSWAGPGRAGSALAVLPAPSTAGRGEPLTPLLSPFPAGALKSPRASP